LKATSQLLKIDPEKDEINLRDVLLIAASINSHFFLDKDKWTWVLDIVAVGAAYTEYALELEEAFIFVSLLSTR